jgi:hypothetical protein
MPDVSVLAAVAREAERPAPGAEPEHMVSRLSQGDLLHPGLGLVVILLIQVLNVYKPRGMTRYGWRKEDELRMSGRGSTRGDRLLQP